MLTLLLEGEGYDVIAARDGLEGLVKMELQHPSLVLLDLMMPNVSGDRVLEEIRGDSRLQRVPVIVVSGRHDVHEAFDRTLGRENVFDKPLDPNRLLERIASILGTTGKGEQ
jgi:DNA-binding response OmpR family regulator